MANITERISKDGKISFLIRITNGQDADNKRQYVTKTYTPVKQTKVAARKEAEKYAEELEDNLKSGKIANGCTIKFSDFIDDWYNSWAKDNLAVSTASSYKDQLKRYAVPFIGSMALMDIQKMHIQNIFLDMEDKGLSTGTIKRAKAALVSLFSYALDGKHLIAENPCDISIKYTVKKQKKSEKVYNVFSPEEYKRFLDFLNKELESAKESNPHALVYLQQQDVLLFTMAIYGGFRRGELLALTWNDIDFKKNLVSISKSLSQVKGKTIIKEPKTASGKRIIDMPSFVMTLLKDWKNTVKRLSIQLGSEWNGTGSRSFDDNFVFVSLVPHYYGKHLDENVPSHKTRDFVKKYNSLKENKNQKLPKICFHDLRHTHVTDLISRGVQIDKIAKRVGHKDVYVTLTVYAHYLKSENDHSISDLFENAI